MACPKCGCKTTYPFVDDDDYGQHSDDLERCAHCGNVFYADDALDEDD